jgi:hypothetical protein
VAYSQEAFATRSPTYYNSTQITSFSDLIAGPAVAFGPREVAQMGLIGLKKSLAFSEILFRFSVCLVTGIEVRYG